ncbi:MAG: DUF1565 domain-containing protein [Deltaproteobacteria bacterium]|nr:DUF1565 domain-containing protein [Deltaproteobacteria bacterium]
MEHKIGWVGLFLMVAGCGSGSGTTPPTVPALSQSAPVSKTVSFEPGWPDDLKSIAQSLKLNATLKGKDSLGKAAGSLGPVEAEAKGNVFQFVFTSVPSELVDAAIITVELFNPVAGLNSDCQKVGRVTQTVTFADNKGTFLVSPGAFDLSMDCDGDGISNLKEFVVETKPNDSVAAVPATPVEIVPVVIPDIDGDGRIDPEDNCPVISNFNQQNSDGDELGDLCDCKPLDENIYSTAVDEPDVLGFDSNCDGIDGNKTEAIFVSLHATSDNNPGSLDAPLKTLSAAVEKAEKEGKAIYVGAGTYSLNGISFSKGIRVYGGYQTFGLDPSFSVRRATSSEPQFDTVLKRDGEDVTLMLQDTSGDFVFDGFHFVNASTEKDSVVGARTIVVKNAHATISNSRIDGSALGTRTTAVAILETVASASDVVLKNNILDAGLGDDASTGVLVDTADAVEISNNVIHGGSGRFATGIVVVGASPRILNNTIDAVSHFSSPQLSTSQALIFENALNLTLTGNILVTGVSANQYGMGCVGMEPVDASRINANVLAVIPPDTDAVKSVSCLGEFDYVAADGLLLGRQTAESNFDFTGNALEDLLSDSQYQNQGAPR